MKGPSTNRAAFFIAVCQALGFPARLENNSDSRCNLFTIAQTRAFVGAQHPSMTTAVEYHQFAHDCGQLATHARNARQREFLVSLVKLWETAALTAEQKILERADPAAPKGINLAA